MGKGNEGAGLGSMRAVLTELVLNTVYPSIDLLELLVVLRSVAISTEDVCALERMSI